ncbi:hypothetical protein LTR53_020007, partial [Teratosphaeriaceae sp. CCFEE 6253]
THKPQHILRESDGVSHCETGRSGINLPNAQHDEDSGKERHESADDIDPECKPTVRAPKVDKWT